MVEHNLAKVGVESSSLFSRSKVNKTKSARAFMLEHFFYFRSRVKKSFSSTPLFALTEMLFRTAKLEEGADQDHTAALKLLER